MAETISDCQVILCRGMGTGAYRSMEHLGIRPILTDNEEIETAVKAYLDGAIVDLVDRLH
jgi:predicted Fe-Mo cluster-binding NifX family protein